MISLILAGLLKAIRDLDAYAQGESWLHRIGFLKRFSDSHLKVGPFPLDLWHTVEIAMFVILIGWVETAILLTSFTVGYHFLFRRKPFHALREWWRKLFICKEDFTIK